MALPGNDNEETLLWKLVVRTQDAIKDVEDFRKRVDELKVKLKEISAESGETFNVIAKSIRKSLQKGVNDAKTSLKDLQATLKDLQNSKKPLHHRQVMLEIQKLLQK